MRFNNSAANAAPATVQQFDKNSGYGVSGKFVPVNTLEFVRRFEREGYSVASISKARCLKADKQGFQKHLIRLRHTNMPEIGGLFPEIVIVNAYDGTAAFRIMLGLFRLVCANGLVTGTTFQQQRVVHLGNALERVLVAAQTVQTQLPMLTDTVQRWSGIQLSSEQVETLEQRAAELILPDGAWRDEFSGQTWKRGQLLDLTRVRRGADAGNDLFRVYNRIQENLLNGGLRYSIKNPETGLVQHKTMRRVNSLDRNVELNQRLWDLVDQTAKAAA